MLFAVSGFANDPVTHFDVGIIVSEASKGRTSINAKAQATLKALIRRTPREIAILKADDPDGYARIVSEKKDFVSVLFFGLEKGDVIATGFGLKVAISKNGKVGTSALWHSCPGSDCPNGIYIFYLGEHDAIDRYMAGSGHRLEGTPVDAVKFLVGLEIIDKPKEVQGPIDVLRVDSSGPQWICHKKECPDIRK